MKSTEEIERDILGKINELISTVPVDSASIDAAYRSKFGDEEQNFIKKNPSFTMMTLANALHYSGVEEKARKFVGGAVLGAMGFKFGEELSTENIDKYYKDQINSTYEVDAKTYDKTTSNLHWSYKDWNYNPFEIGTLRSLAQADLSSNNLLFSNMFRFSIMSQPKAFEMITDNKTFDEYLQAKGVSVLTNELRYFRNKNNKFDISKIFEMVQRLFCQNLTIPGVNLEINIDYVYGVPRHVITGRRFDPIQITFFNDSQGILRRFFFLWMMLIEQNDLNGYRFFPNEIKTRLRIEHFEAFVKGSGYSIIIDGAFPSSISDVQLDHAMGDLSKFTVTFDYNQYYYDVYHKSNY